MGHGISYHVPYIICQTLRNVSTGENKEEVTNKNFSRNTLFNRYLQFIFFTKIILSSNFFKTIFMKLGMVFKLNKQFRHRSI